MREPILGDEGKKERTRRGGGYVTKDPSQLSLPASEARGPGKAPTVDLEGEKRWRGDQTRREGKEEGDFLLTSYDFFAG